ncbi:winged helix-turn-helix transcriptional regulator [Hyphococcus sp.]|uniref:winged helix-turn-helix transcriptional regulator n=1 Tax=Hyphococcus sp. TaxID=2038636 RepID=UPI0035C715B4
MSKTPDFKRSPCPLAVTLDIVGDKWSLIVIRDLFRGVSRYSDFLKSPEDMTTNILADRLKRLEEHGLISKSAYQENPVRHEYALTKKGRALGPVLREIVHWANAYYPGTIKPSLDKL